MRKIFVADAHCDSIGEMYRPFEFYKNKGHLDLKRMSAYDGWLQIFAVWTDPKKETELIRKHFFESTDSFFAQSEKFDDVFSVVRGAAELEYALKTGKCAGIIAVEGGEVLGNDSDYIDILYERGVRVITLTWNYENAVGCGAGCDCDRGLSEFGKNVVKKMNQKGIIADVSHASQKTFWDVARVSGRAFMASHSNARKMCDHPRNLDDEQIKFIVGKNGFIGVNFFPQFLNESGKAGVDDICRHIEHFIELGAENVLGLGSDFDGIDYTPRRIKGVQSVYKIAQRLLRLNYPEETVEKIMGINLKNFLIREMKNGEDYD